MKIQVYLERSDVRGGIEVFAERHVAALRAEGHEVEGVGDRQTIKQSNGQTIDEVVVHKCTPTLR